MHYVSIGHKGPPGRAHKGGTMGTKKKEARADAKKLQHSYMPESKVHKDCLRQFCSVHKGSPVSGIWLLVSTYGNLVTPLLTIS